MALLLTPGCALNLTSKTEFSPAYRPRNVYAWGSSLPPQIRRVALLPLACDETAPDALESRDALQPVLLEELVKSQRFEVISISPEILRDRTRQGTWSCEESLPPELFAWLSQNRGCDAVLFCRLTVVRGYAPLAIGWRMRLVDLHTRATLWAADELFDAGQPAVRAGAHRYQQLAFQGDASCDRWLIDNSPRRFGQYAAAQVLATLPRL